MSILDKAKPYGTITGHPVAVYMQNGLMYDGAGQLLGSENTASKDERVLEDTRAMTDALVNAIEFLKTILASGPVSKAAVYKEAENNNQVWSVVKDAALELKVHMFQYRKSEMWKLPEE